MNLLLAKTKEVILTLIPVVVLVLILSFTFVDIESDMMIRFLIGSGLLLVGLSIFLWGIEISMNPIGEYMSKEIATSNSLIKILILGFLLGFLVTVAEPDLTILGKQIESASGGTLNSTLIVYVVSTGVGITISFGILRLLRGKPKFNVFMTIIYALILVLAIFNAPEFLAISVDASGATTGALTTPFILALTLGLSTIKGGKDSEENSFGLVGVMSAGPILAILAMSLISGQRHIQGDAAVFSPAKGVLGPILSSIPSITFESLLALLPLTVLFFVLNFAKFKIPKRKLLSIVGGLLLTLFGLILFFTGVNSGFMDMGWVIGMQIAALDYRLLVIIGFLLGMIIVLMEPAVHVLGEQIEEVTAGHIPIKLIKITLSLGVAIAIALSMVRIIFPSVQLWYFLLPGFGLGILLSYWAEPVFVGIAFDAGGVASGPMTATFALAFAQGAATVIPTANVLVDGFGIIAMVAMAPVFSLMVLGVIFKRKARLYPVPEEIEYVAEEGTLATGVGHSCIMAVVNRGYGEEVVLLARQNGATGATILNARGSDEKGLRIPLVNIEVQPEKEIILLITDAQVSSKVATQLGKMDHLVVDGKLALYLSPAEALVKELPPLK